jgi:hypothetical protein
MDLKVKNDVAGFLVVLIDCSGGTEIKLTQVGLIEHVINAMHLDGSKAKSTPTETGGLPADKDGEPCSEVFNYSSVVGMLMYLSTNTRPDIAFTTHQCARYTHLPHRVHEVALKQIVPYLVGTHTNGLLL